MVAVKKVRKHQGQPYVVCFLKLSPVIEGIAGMCSRRGQEGTPPSALLQPCPTRRTFTPIVTPHSHPSAACALLTGLAKKATLQEGSKRSWGQQAFPNFFVSVWTQIQQHAATWAILLPVFFILWKMRTLQRSWLYPQLCDNSVFCHLAVTLSSPPLLTGSQSLL